MATSAFLSGGIENMGEVIVKLSKVDTIYEGEHLPAIKGINLEIRQGEMVSIVGPNGSGKTTLLETVNGLLKVSRGEVRVFNVDMSRDPMRARKDIGYVPQDFISDPSVPFLAQDVVLMGRYGKLGLLKSPRKVDFEIAREAMRLVGVEEFAHRPIGKLSGGEQQKVMIARTIAQEPKLLLLDEPFSNLDIDSRKEISEKICRLHEENNWTTIVVTHDLFSIPKRCNRVLVMDRGKIVAEEDPESVMCSVKSLTGFYRGLRQ